MSLKASATSATLPTVTREMMERVWEHHRYCLRNLRRASRVCRRYSSGDTSSAAREAWRDYERALGQVSRAARLEQRTWERFYAALYGNTSEQSEQSEESGVTASQ